MALEFSETLSSPVSDPNGDGGNECDLEEALAGWDDDWSEAEGGEAPDNSDSTCSFETLPQASTPIRAP